MLFTWKRLKKFISVLLLILFTLTVFTFKAAVKSRGESLLGFLPWVENEEEIDSDNNDDSMPEEIDDGKRNTRPIKVITANKQIEVQVEDARTSEERATGLMYRESLRENFGMVFIFDEDVSGGFWMRNCKISLDVIFIDSNGKVVDIKEDFAPCREDPCPVYSPVKDYRYVLEVNGGWIGKNGVAVGDNIEKI